MFLIRSFVYRKVKEERLLVLHRNSNDYERFSFPKHKIVTRMIILSENLTLKETLKIQETLYLIIVIFVVMYVNT